MDTKIDALEQRVDTRIDALEQRVDTRIDALEKSIVKTMGHKLSEMFNKNMRWTLGAMGVMLVFLRLSEVFIK